MEKKQDYYFEAAEKTIIEELSGKDFEAFKRLLEKKSKEVKKEDYGLHDILSFLLDIAKKNDEKQFSELAVKFAPILGCDDVNEFLQDYKHDRQLSH